MFIGSIIVHRMVADRLNLPLDEVSRVIADYDQCVQHYLLALRQPVRILGGLGYLKVIETKARTVRSPIVGLVDVPAKQKIVFRLSQKKDEAEKAVAKARRQSASKK